MDPQPTTCQGQGPLTLKLTSSLSEKKRFSSEWNCHTNGFFWFAHHHTSVALGPGLESMSPCPSSGNTAAAFTQIPMEVQQEAEAGYHAIGMLRTVLLHDQNSSLRLCLYPLQCPDHEARCSIWFLSVSRRRTCLTYSKCLPSTCSKNGYGRVTSD